MRLVSGRRFLIAIGLPIFLASAGVLSLTSDLLDQVSVKADTVENVRNRAVVQNALQDEEKDLGQLARQNAQWDEAFTHVYPKVDEGWFNQTWGSMNSIGQAFDFVAVFERTGRAPLIAKGIRPLPVSNVRDYLGPSFAEMMQRLPATSMTAGLATAQVVTPDGPAVVAMAPIVPVSPALAAVDSEPRYLLMVKHLDGVLLNDIQSRLLIRDLRLGPADGAKADGLLIKSLTGEPIFSLSWIDRNIGLATTFSARQKAAAVLGFLMLVMTGIAVVCWRLLQSVAQSEEKARHDALHDSLTGLPNRAAMIQCLKLQKAGAEENYAIAYADLDGFKEVNDSYGHHLGDKLLRAVGAGIAELAQKSRLASRMGGDEFVVLFCGAEAANQARSFAANLLRFLANPFDLDGRIASVGASIGIAPSDGAEMDENEILRRSDVAMYRAKADGKNRYRVYDAAFDMERQQSQAIAAELTRIIALKSLDVEFQPVISARNLRISGVEALARWPKSSPVSVPAEKFIAVAEYAGIVDDLGELVLDKACAAAKAWPELRLAVNVSAVQLNNPKFVERSLAVLDRHDISPRRVEFEITETSLIRDAERAKAVFKELQRAGIKVALDDFGTGFSSIGYLRTFAFDRIKIDKSIISKVLSNPAELAIVQGTLLVARGLSAEVTAEGVEREEEVAVLKLAGCTELQGFHFHEPMPAQGITALLETARARSQQRRMTG